MTRFEVSEVNEQARPLRFAKLREELVAVTGDWVKALILDRFLYFSERGRRSDGWIWKSSEELADLDLFGCSSRSTVSRRLSGLVGDGYIMRRKNPDNPKDNTLQYRVDFRRLHKDLKNAGYSLEGWHFPTPVQAAQGSVQGENADVQAAQTLPENTVQRIQTKNPPPSSSGNQQQLTTTDQPTASNPPPREDIPSSENRPKVKFSGGRTEETVDELTKARWDLPDHNGRSKVPHVRRHDPEMFRMAWKRATGRYWNRDQSERLNHVVFYWTKKEIDELLLATAQKNPREPWPYFKKCLENAAAGVAKSSGGMTEAERMQAKIDAGPREPEFEVGVPIWEQEEYAVGGDQ